MSIPFDTFRARIAELYATGKHATKTRYRMAQAMRELAQLGVESTGDLTTQTMARYVASKPGGNPNTINGMLAAIAAACSYAVEERWLDRAPAWRRVRLRPGPTVRNLPPTFEQIGRLLDRLRAKARAGRWEDRRLSALVWTFALTGLRLMEALHLKPNDLDLGEQPRLTVSPRRRLKTEQSAATVPAPDQLAAELREWLPHAGAEWVFPGTRRRGPWTGGSPGYRAIDHLNRAAKEAGIGHLTWHSLRHAYGTYGLEKWDLPLWVVQQQLRHTDQRTTAGYLHMSGSPRAAECVRGISYLPHGRPDPLMP